MSNINEGNVMETTQDFTVYKYSIDGAQSSKPIYLIPFGDIHRNSPNCHVEKWHEFLEWAKKKKNCYFLGMGDYNDMFSTSERKSLASINLHDSSLETLDDIYKRSSDEFYKEISFMKGRVIGMLEGNHHATLQSGITTTQRLCDNLGCKYLGTSAFIRLVTRDKVGNSYGSLDIFAHHGLGGGRTLGSSVNKLEAMLRVANFDIGLMGHDHKKSIQMFSILELSDGRSTFGIKNKKIVLARTGSFLRGFVDGKKSYVAKAMLSPADLGVVKLELTPRKLYGAYKLDIHGSI